MNSELAAPGVIRIPVPLAHSGIGPVNTYVLRDERDGHVLVDCGPYHPDRPQHGLDGLATAMDDRGMSLGDLRAVLVTHAHVDHYGLAGLIVERTDAELWMHAAALLDFFAFTQPETERERLHRVLSGHGLTCAETVGVVDVILLDWAPYLHSVVEPTVPLWGGEQLAIGGRSYEVLHTPGHLRSHICLWSAEEQIFFSGDHMLPGIAPNLSFHHGLDDDPMGQYIDGLELVESLGPALVMPGHGRPFGDGGRRARSIIDNKRRRNAQIREAIGSTPVTVAELTRSTYPKAVEPFQLRTAVGEMLGHVNYLRKRDLIGRLRSEDGLTRFQRQTRAA